MLGIDQSLSGTGLSFRNSRTGALRTHTVKTGELRGPARLERILELVDWAIRESSPSLVVLEGIGGAFSGARRNSGTTLIGLCSLLGVLQLHLWRARLPYTVVPPTTVKMLVAGSGSAKKPDVVASLAAFYGVSLARHDEADACALMILGEHIVGARSSSSRKMLQWLSSVEIESREPIRFSR